MKMDNTSRHPRKIQFTRFVETVRRIGGESAIEELGHNFSNFVRPVRHKNTAVGTQAELPSRPGERHRAD